MNINRSISFLFVIIACVSANSSQPEENSFCQGCRSIVSFMGNLNGTESRDQFKELFRDFCETYYPTSTDHPNPCNWFVNGVFFVMDRTDPVYHCDQIGACGKPALSLQRRINNGLSPNTNDQFCSVCEQLVNETKSVLDSPVAIDMAINQLNVLCDYLSVVGLSKECKQQVSKYIDQVVEFVHNVDPLNYCQSIQLCDSKKLMVASRPMKQADESFDRLIAETSQDLIEMISPIDIQRVESTSVVEPKFGLQGPGCVLCKTIVKELFHFLKENKTEENIKYGLERICKLIYSDEDKVNECNNMVDTYARELIEILAAESDPNLVCILIEQCTYQKLPNQPEITKQQLFLTGPTILEETEPSERSTVKTMNFADFVTALSPNVTSFETCLECKVFIKYLRDKLEQPHTEANVKDFILTKLCKNLEDKDLQNSCENLVDNYADIFFKAVVSDLDPQSACVAMAACQNLAIEPLEAIIATMNPPFSKGLKELQEMSPRNVLQCSYCKELADKIDEFLSAYGKPLEEGTLVSEICPNLPPYKQCLNMINESEQVFVQHINDMKGSEQVCKLAKYC